MFRDIIESIVIQVLCLLSLVLSGCTERSLRQSQPKDACAAVAAQRAQDAGYNGIDRDMQNKIYDHTYRDCVVWARRSGRIATPTP